LKDILVDEFQYTVSDLLVRNKSIIDQITKFQDSNARVNRAIVKSVTQCGCVKINATKQDFSFDGDINEIQQAMETHLEGKLCDNCRDMIEKDIGRNLFYLASICNSLDLNLYDIIIKEIERIKMLGKYNLR
jgi:formamidopyrimidine-DNA glycosylase